MTEKTEAAVLFELGKPLRVVPLALPELKPGQVLVEMAYSGVCHSQLLEISGKRGPDPHLPHTLGHEGSGKVLKVGKNVTKVKSGDSVVVSWIKGKGAEVPFTLYQSEKGPVNSGAVSTFMRRTVVSENRLVPVSAKLPLREAALLGCAFPTGAGIIFNTAKVQPDSTVVVFGAGGIGLSVILAASHIPRVTVFAVDILDHKLEQAKRLGAVHTIHAQKENPLQAILRLTSNRGADYAVECAGRKETMETAFQCVRDNGGLCVLAGNLPKGENISLDPFNLIRGKRIVGTWGGETDLDRDIPHYEKMFLEGDLNLGALISHDYGLEEVNQAFEDLKQGKVNRGVLQL